MNISITKDKFSIDDVLTDVAVVLNTTEGSETLKIADI